MDLDGESVSGKESGSSTSVGADEVRGHQGHISWGTGEI